MPLRVANHILTLSKDKKKLVVDSTQLFPPGEWSEEKHKELMAELFRLSCPCGDITINVCDELITLHRRDIEVLPDD